MEKVLQDIPETDPYIDNVGILKLTWKHKLSLALQCLQDNGFTVNSLKREWAVQETDWLTY
jgi:hypothetical protein